jgi:hypothetical protein
MSMSSAEKRVAEAEERRQQEQERRHRLAAWHQHLQEMYTARAG